MVAIGITDGDGGNAAVAVEAGRRPVACVPAGGDVAYLNDAGFGRHDRLHRIGDVIDRFAAIDGDARARQVEMVVVAEEHAAGVCQAGINAFECSRGLAEALAADDH